MCCGLVTPFLTRTSFFVIALVYCVLAIVCLSVLAQFIAWKDLSLYLSSVTLNSAHLLSKILK